MLIFKRRVHSRFCILNAARSIVSHVHLELCAYIVTYPSGAPTRCNKGDVRVHDVYAATSHDMYYREKTRILRVIRDCVQVPAKLIFHRTSVGIVNAAAVVHLRLGARCSSSA